jgi:copper homeostasis protein
MLPDRPIALEVAVDGRERLERALQFPCQRLELCERLDLDGLTPSAAWLAEARQRTRLPLFCMLRSRAGSFVLGRGELGNELRELERLRDGGADGVVLGWINDQGQPDQPALRQLVRAAGPLPLTFHRAFDRCANPLDALECLIELGFSRVLSSGGAPSAWEGRARLAQLVERAGARLTVVAAGGVRAEHAAALARATGVRELHGSVPFDPALCAQRHRPSPPPR